MASQPSAPGLRGHIDPRHPHSINSLIVQYLGTEEVIAAARDDGDVDVFLVRHIAHAIDRRAEHGNTIISDPYEVRPIFQRNVGESAWGLAIHSKCRIIAASANNQQVTIFKLGLVNDDGHVNENVDHDDDNDSAERIGEDDREIDVTYRVVNGTCNIPFIAFCNTGDDPGARWLLTTDISGYCRAIDLENMQTAQKFRFNRPSLSNPPNDFDPVNAGWAIMFLDSRSFISQTSLNAAIGVKEGQSLPGFRVNGSIWDISSTVQNIPDASQTFIKKASRLRTTRPVPVSVNRNWDVRSDDTAEETDTTTITTRTDEQTVSSRASPSPETAPAQQDSQEAEDDDAMSLYSGEMDSDDDFDRDFAWRSAWTGPLCESPNNLCGELPCPILHASVRNVFLLQPSDRRVAGESPCSSPTVSRVSSHTPRPRTIPNISDVTQIGFTNALQQYVQADLAYINVFERLNLHAYLPSLGLVILASQKGRAVLVSLTKIDRPIANERIGKNNPSGEAQAQPIYAMRIARLLPLAAQEAADARPFAPLAGLAAGPIQGTEHRPDEKKRWRVLLYYADHTVLSYEVRRRATARTAGLEVESWTI